MAAVSKVPLTSPADARKVRDVGVGDGVGVVNAEVPVLIVFDDVTVHELPQSCCVSWLFPLLENMYANAMCPLPIIAVLTSSTANIAIVISLMVQF